MKLKVGNRLLSKKELIRGWFEPGKYYYIKALDDEHIFISSNMEFNKGYWFTFEPEKYYNDPYIWNYFYTNQELRKIKINELESR